MGIFYATIWNQGISHGIRGMEESRFEYRISSIVTLKILKFVEEFVFEKSFSCF